MFDLLLFFRNRDKPSLPPMVSVRELDGKYLRRKLTFTPSSASQKSEVMLSFLRTNSELRSFKMEKSSRFVGSELGRG